MIRRSIRIGRWQVEFYFARESYDVETLLDRMYDFGATATPMRQALALMEEGGKNTGFTFANPVERVALIAVGPTTSGEQFQNTLVHELHHLAVSIASSLGIDLEAETPAYIAGDSAMALADVICKMGCEHCHTS